MVQQASEQRVYELGSVLNPQEINQFQSAVEDLSLLEPWDSLPRPVLVKLLETLAIVRHDDPVDLALPSQSVKASLARLLTACGIFQHGDWHVPWYEVVLPLLLDRACQQVCKRQDLVVLKGYIDNNPAFARQFEGALLQQSYAFFQVVSEAKKRSKPLALEQSDVDAVQAILQGISETCRKKYADDRELIEVIVAWKRLCNGCAKNYGSCQYCPNGVLNVFVKGAPERESALGHLNYIATQGV